MRDIFQSLQNVMDETFQIQDLASDSMMSIRSPLRYKYKPTIRYGLELYPHSTAAMGRLKISFRTQNVQLLQDLNGFFQIWIVLENHYIGKYFPQGISYTKENERYVRELNYPANLENCSSEDAGEAIGTYIKMLDDMIKLYFSNIDLAGEQLTAVLESRYRQYLSIPRFPII